MITTPTQYLFRELLILIQHGQIVLEVLWIGAPLAIFLTITYAGPAMVDLST
jgi:hypothetical protein